jgi:hypothetical protein
MFESVPVLEGIVVRSLNPRGGGDDGQSTTEEARQAPVQLELDFL